MKAPLARAAASNFATCGTWLAQRSRRCGVQVCVVKSIARIAVSFATSVTGLSAGAGGSFTPAHSSITDSAWAPDGTAMLMAATSRVATKDVRYFIPAPPFRVCFLQCDLTLRGARVYDRVRVEVACAAA